MSVKDENTRIITTVTKEVEEIVVNFAEKERRTKSAMTAILIEKGVINMLTKQRKTAILNHLHSIFNDDPDKVYTLFGMAMDDEDEWGKITSFETDEEAISFFMEQYKWSMKEDENSEELYKEILEECFENGVIQNYDPKKLKELFENKDQ